MRDGKQAVLAGWPAKGWARPGGASAARAGCRSDSLFGPWRATAWMPSPAGLPPQGPIVVRWISPTDASVAEAAGQVGQIDVGLLLAGVYLADECTQSWTAYQHKAVAMALDVNFTWFRPGLWAHARADSYRPADFGQSSSPSSLNRVPGLPGSRSAITAAKAGTDVAAECMHAYLRNTGVGCRWSSGFVRTRLTERTIPAMPQIMEPEAAARVKSNETTCWTTASRKAFPPRAPVPGCSGWVSFLPDWLFTAPSGADRAA